MGWISKRKMETGSGIGGRRKGRTYPKDGAPLRKIVGIIVPQTDIFSQAHVLLECGHEGLSWGGVRARCPKCKDEGRT